MNIHFELEDKSYGTSNISVASNVFTLFYPCNSRSSCTNYISSFPAGIYIFEVWGCSGGLNGGLGGYSKGTVELRRRTKIRIFIGSEGESLIGTRGYTNPSFNGGGRGFSGHSELESGYRSSSSGGGSSDIRFNSGSLYHRVLVAGGGGGGTAGGSTQYFGGDAGGEQGFKRDDDNYYGEGANQTSAGIGEFEFNSTSTENGRFSGVFGHGGQGYREGTNGGGGSGWYGGSSGCAGTSRGGGGGSGYVLNQTSYKPDNYLVDDPSYYFSDSAVLSGRDSFPSCFNNQTYETGHIGSGCARITVIFSSDEAAITCHNSGLPFKCFSLFSIF